MADTPDGETDVSKTGSWMGDVQRALALLVIGCLVICTTALIIRLVATAEIDDITDIAKIMLAALVNMGLIALGFFFGSSQSKEKADASQQKIMDKLTSASPGTLPPTPPGDSTAPIPPWWARLTDEEKNTITAASAGDPRVAAFISASQVGAANADDLAYLVTKGLLTQPRADEIKA